MTTSHITWWKEVKSQTHHPKSHDITATQRQKLRSNPKKNLGHRNGRSSCAHSIGKFFLCYMVLFSFETSAAGSPGNYLYILYWCYIVYTRPVWIESSFLFRPDAALRKRTLFRLGRGLPHISKSQAALHSTDFSMLKTRLRFKDKNAFTAASRSIANGPLKGLCAAQGKANHSIHPTGSSSNSVELCWAPHSFLLAGDGVDRLRQRPNIATRQENANPASWNDIFADSSHFVLSFSFAC